MSVSRYFKRLILLIGPYAIAKKYDGDCFKESDLYGYDPKKLAEPTVSDASYLFNNELMEESMKPHALKVCV